MKKKILIAEDYEPLVELYSVWLNGDYEILHARNGIEAVDLYIDHRPDLILMDIRMPGMNGHEAIKLVRGHDPQARIIAVTSYPYSEEYLGVPVIRKGFNKIEFLQMCRQGLADEPNTMARQP